MGRNRGRKVTIPGYLVKRTEEDKIEYHVSSPIANELHPMRPKPEELKAKEEAEAVKAEVAEKQQEIHVAKPKLKKIIVTELKEEKEEDIEKATPAAPPEDKG